MPTLRHQSETHLMQDVRVIRECCKLLRNMLECRAIN